MINKKVLIGIGIIVVLGISIFFGMTSFNKWKDDFYKKGMAEGSLETIRIINNNAIIPVITDYEKNTIVLYNITDICSIIQNK